MTEARAKAREFLALAQRHVEDGDVRGAIELTDGAMEWLKLWRQESNEAFEVYSQRAGWRYPPEHA